MCTEVAYFSLRCMDIHFRWDIRGIAMHSQQLQVFSLS